MNFSEKNISKEKEFPDEKVLQIKKESGRLIVSLKSDIENNKYSELIAEIEEEINQLPEEFKKSLLGIGKHPIKIKIIDFNNTKHDDSGGFYRKTTDTIYIPIDYIDRLKEWYKYFGRSGNIIAHEMSHAIFDNIGIKGLLNLKGITKPTKEEIENYIYSKVLNKRGFTKVFEDVMYSIEEIKIKSASKILDDTIKEAEKNKKAIKKHFLSYKKRIKESQDNFFNKKILTKKEEYIQNYIKKHGKKILEQINDPKKILEIQQAYKELDNLIKIAKKLKQEQQDLLDIKKIIKTKEYKKFIKNSGNITKEEKTKIGWSFIMKKRKNFIENFEKFKEFFNIVKNDVKKAYSNLKYIYELEYKYSNLDLKAELKIGDNKEEIKKIIVDIEEIKKVFLDGIQAIYYYDFLGFDMLGLEDLIIEDKINKLNKDIFSVEEVFARIVDSLISGYNGKLNQNNYPLDEEDLEFLGKFKKDGKPIFGEHIKKYREKYLRK